jgi:NAD(P)-dependent dehydrogenase (short-subunit alcohol dehydrogenase family)
MSKSKVRLVVLTGATRGLGRAMAEKLIELGHTVLGCGRSRDQIDCLRQTFSKPHDLLLNNAALVNRNAPLWKISTEEFDRVIDVNLKGVANVIRHFLPAMVARKSGVIVNFSSGWGRSTSGEVAPYCATKFAIEGLTRALAQELPAGMAAVPLNPGIIDTDMLRSTFGGGANRYPAPEDWSETAVPFLLQLSAKDNGKSLTAPG